MKIGIDARLYGTPHGGIGRYTENLINQLEKIDQSNQFFVFLQKDGFEKYHPGNKNFQKVLADYKVYGLREQIALPAILNRYKLDLVHFTHFNVPIFYTSKFIATIHDLIISHYPNSRATTLNPVLYKIKLFFYQIIIRLTARRASKIIAVSQYTKDDIVSLLKIKPEKITVTYEGVELPQETHLDCQKVKNELGISDNFLLYVGSAYPHKNLERLLQAMVGVDSDLKLVLVGKKNYFYQRLEKEIDRLQSTDRVVLTDYISDEKLACLYKTAKLYVFPSLIEGFGLPPLEAQSYKLPVISSNSSCLPEVLGDSVVYFDPKSVEEMTSKINDTLKNTELMEDLKRKGSKNLEQYSWELCAKKTLAEYFN